MSEERFRQHLASEPLLHAASLALAIEQVSTLPCAIVGLGGPIRVAAIESFMVNIRLIGDFLLKDNDRDLRPKDFAVRWSRRNLGPEPTDGPSGGESDRAELRARLDSLWDDASKFVVHFGKRRFTDLTERPMNSTSMTVIATDALTALAPFIRAVRAAR